MAGNRNKIMPRSFDKNRSNLTNKLFSFFLFFWNEEEDLFFLRQEEETQKSPTEEGEREREGAQNLEKEEEKRHDVETGHPPFAPFEMFSSSLMVFQ